MVGKWPTMATELTRDMLQNPLWRDEDLGCPIPDSAHAVSMCLPTWDSVIGYEERDPEVILKLRCGYPRFVLNPAICHLNEQWRKEYAPREAEEVWIFPSEEAAGRCYAAVRECSPDASAGFLACRHGAWMVWIGADEPGRAAAKEFWRLSGEGIGSRLATRLRDGGGGCVGESAMHGGLRAKLASEYGVDESLIYLFPSGMAAAYTVHRFFEAMFAGRSTVQLDFPYVDTWRVQKCFTKGGARFISPMSEDMLGELREVLVSGEISGVFAEIPSNPLLHTVDLVEVARICGQEVVPLVVDDTVASVRNLSVLPYADFVTTSLTKWFSGAGDVMAGSVVVREDSPWAGAFCEWMKESGAVPLDVADAEVLLGNARDFSARMDEVNANGYRLARYLQESSVIGRVYYPCLEPGDSYADLLREGGGCGGLISIVFKGGEEAARLFYDALRLCKGPSLGTNFSLVCPYTLLAHYDELEWVGEHGVDPFLVRISVGREPWVQIRECIGAALGVVERGA